MPVAGQRLSVQHELAAQARPLVVAIEVLTPNGRGQRDNDGHTVYNRSLLALAQHYGFHPRGCRPCRAKTEGKVERPTTQRAISLAGHSNGVGSTGKSSLDPATPSAPHVGRRGIRFRTAITLDSKVRRPRVRPSARCGHSAGRQPYRMCYPLDAPIARLTVIVATASIQPRGLWARMIKR